MGFLIVFMVLMAIIGIVHAGGAQALLWTGYIVAFLIFIILCNAIGAYNT